MMEPDINSMTLNEYLMYERHRDLARSYTSRKSVAPVRNRILVYPDSDEEDEEYCSLPPLLLCFQTPQPCTIINPVHHNSQNKVDIDNMTLEEYARYELAMSSKTINTPYGFRPYDHEDGELSDLPIFSATNEFASVCKHVEENINTSIAEEKEVPMGDVKIDENHDIDHLGTKEALQ
ncbi:hypothetical protein Tco_1347349 [Tanacetum coccineum]